MEKLVCLQIKALWISYWHSLSQNLENYVGTQLKKAPHRTHHVPIPSTDAA